MDSAYIPSPSHSNSPLLSSPSSSSSSASSSRPRPHLKLNLTPTNDQRLLTTTNDTLTKKHSWRPSSSSSSSSFSTPTFQYSPTFLHPTYFQILPTPSTPLSSSELPSFPSKLTTQLSRLPLSAHPLNTFSNSNPIDSTSLDSIPNITTSTTTTTNLTDLDEIQTKKKKSKKSKINLTLLVQYLASSSLETTQALLNSFENTSIPPEVQAKRAKDLKRFYNPIAKYTFFSTLTQLIQDSHFLPCPFWTPSDEDPYFWLDLFSPLQQDLEYLSTTSLAFQLPSTLDLYLRSSSSTTTATTPSLVYSLPVTSSCLLEGLDRLDLSHAECICLDWSFFISTVPTTLSSSSFLPSFASISSSSSIDHELSSIPYSFILFQHGLITVRPHPQCTLPYHALLNLTHISTPTKLSSSSSSFNVTHTHANVCSPSWILYTLLDVSMQSVFARLRHLDQSIDVMEEEVFQVLPTCLPKLRSAHKLVTQYLRLLHSKNEVLKTLLNHGQAYLHGDDSYLYLRVLQGHIESECHALEYLKEKVIQLHTIYLTRINLRLTQSSLQSNRIMQRVSFQNQWVMPFSFLIGLFGMNVPVPGQSSCPSATAATTKNPCLEKDYSVFFQILVVLFFLFMILRGIFMRLFFLTPSTTTTGRLRPSR